MNATVVPLGPNSIIPVERGPDPNVIEMIEGLLEEAKNGFIQSVAYVALSRDQTYKYNIAGDDRVLNILGAISILQHNIIKAHNDD